MIWQIFKTAVWLIWRSKKKDWAKKKRKQNACVRSESQRWTEKMLTSKASYRDEWEEQKESATTQNRKSDMAQMLYECKENDMRTHSINFIRMNRKMTLKPKVWMLIGHDLAKWNVYAKFVLKLNVVKILRIIWKTKNKLSIIDMIIFKERIFKMNEMHNKLIGC